LRLLVLDLPFTQPLLPASLSFEVLLLPTQALLLLPCLGPVFIEQRQPQGQDRIDVLRFPIKTKNWGAPTNSCKIFGRW
jgi:hypothetical protein